MPTVNDDFNRTCTRLDLHAEWSMVLSSDAAKITLDEDGLREFNDSVALVAAGTPAFSSAQIAGAARRLVRAVGAGNEPRFIRTRMRRAAEIRAMLKDEGWAIDPALLGCIHDLLGYLDRPVALVPVDMPAIGGLDRALLVDLAMPKLRAELDEYADFCRFRAGEAERLGVPLAAIDTDRERWSVERAEELRLERLVRRSSGAAYGKSGPEGGVFRVR